MILFFKKKKKTRSIRKGVYAILSGVLLLLFGARYLAERYEEMIHSIIEFGVLDVATARLLAKYLPVLILVSASLVIIGGIIYILKGKVFYASLMIGFGSGASVFNLILTMVLTGPKFKIYILSNQLSKASLIGLNYITVLISIILAYMAIINDFPGFTVSFLSGFFINLSGAMIEYQIIIRFLGIIGLARADPSLIYAIGFIASSGALMFAGALLYGYKRYKLGIVVHIIGVLLFLPLLAFIVMGLSLSVVLVIRAIAGIIGLIFAFMAIIYGFFAEFKKHIKIFPI